MPDLPERDDESSSAAEDDVELRSSLADLSRLGLGDGRHGLEEMLVHVAEFAVRAIPGADGAGVTLLDGAKVDTIVASTGFVRDVDAIQYRLGEGPCITAAAERRTVHSGSLGGERAFPRFGPRVGRMGVHSVLSLPLLVDGSALGAINVYGHRKDAFDEHAIDLGQLFAVPAAVAVQHAKALAHARRTISELQVAITSRTVVDQALGIMMSRVGCTPDEAYHRLRTTSQAENRKVAVVAGSLVDEAVRRARARHRDG